MDPQAFDSQRGRPIARPPVVPLQFPDKPESKYWIAAEEFWSLIKKIPRATQRRTIYLLSASLLAVLLLNMLGQVYLNRWQGHFFRAVERKSFPMIWNEILFFVPLIAGLLVIVVTQTWLHERLKVSLREWLSTKLLDKWLTPARAYRLAITSDAAVNPDQRIQEDVRNFCEMTTDLGVGLLQALLLLTIFIGVLWGMSTDIRFEIGGTRVHIPGYMVWVAIIYATLGSWFTAKVGRPLIQLNEERYTREADFRFAVVRVNENAESIGFYSGEADERKLINAKLESTLHMMRRLALALARLTWVTSGYGWLMIVIPVVVALPGYLQGTLDLGGLMMVVGAFSQVQQSLRWFIDNYARIADWRAAQHRVVVFRDALDSVDVYEGDEEQIELHSHPEGHLVFEGTKISLIDGEEVIADATAHIRPGERVLLQGPSGSGKSTLFRAVGGLWPWGGGKIYLPPREEMMFLPQRSYIPPGTLAAALRYPKTHSHFTPEEMRAALVRANLEEFVSALEQVDRWDKLMSLGQQQRLAFARLLLHKSKWVFLDEATSALDADNQERMMSIFNEELKESTLMSIAHREGLDVYHTRVLHLTPTEGGSVLRRRRTREWGTHWSAFTRVWKSRSKRDRSAAS